MTQATNDGFLWFLSWLVDHFELFNLVYFVEFFVACGGTGWGSHFGQFWVMVVWFSIHDWIDMPNLFDMPILLSGKPLNPEIVIPNPFRYTDLVLYFEPEHWFGRPMQIGTPDQGPGSVDRFHFSLPNQTPELVLRGFSVGFWTIK